MTSDLSSAFLDNFITWFAHKLSLVTVTMWGIQFVSTIPERILLLGLCSLIIATTLAVTRWVRSPRSRAFIPIVAAFLLFRGLYAIFPGDYSGDLALFLTLLIAIIHFRDWRSGTTAPPGLRRFGIVRLVLSIVLVPALAVLLVNGWSLLGLAQTLHRDGAVHKLDSIDLDSLALDTQNALLYASGHGTEYLLAYDVHDVTHPTRRSKVGTDHAQSFSYNQGDHELYVYNEHDDTLLFLAAGTLEQKKSIPDLHMMEGDSRIVYDRRTSSLVIASEGAYWGGPSDESGYPVAVVDRESGVIRYRVRDCDGLCIPGLIEIHPSKPLLYLAFPKKVLLYNTELRKVVATAPINDHWVDGMVVTPDEKELLVGVPLSSTVLRLDAESLELKGAIDTVFGVRTLAVDPERYLLLTASLATNMVDVIDLCTHKRLAKYYVAPWLRSISLDTKAGVAYVSSTEGLFRVVYTARVKPRQTNKAGTSSEWHLS
jgi:DNA-binding beta-propeller fold protein YncE